MMMQSSQIKFNCQKSRIFYKNLINPFLVNPRQKKYALNVGRKTNGGVEIDVGRLFEILLASIYGSYFKKSFLTFF